MFVDVVFVLLNLICAMFAVKISCFDVQKTKEMLSEFSYFYCPNLVQCLLSK